MKYLIALMIATVVCACAPPPKPHVTVQTKKFVPPTRCKQLGGAAMNGWHVVIHKDCLRAGLTTVTFLFKTPIIKHAYRDALRAMQSILGYVHVKLFPIMYSLMPGKRVMTIFGVGE